MENDDIETSVATYVADLLKRIELKAIEREDIILEIEKAWCAGHIAALKAFQSDLDKFQRGFRKEPISLSLPTGENILFVPNSAIEGNE